MNLTARTILILFLVASLSAACQQSTTPPPTAQPSETPTQTIPTATLEPTATPMLDPDIEEYAVYAALIGDQFKGDFVKQLLIMDHTRVPNLGLIKQNLNSLQEYKPLDSRLVYNFLNRNKEPYPLRPALEINWDYTLLTQEEVDELGPKDKESGWQLLDELYPNGVGFIYLSRVGFNSDLSQALVYYERYMYEQPIYGGYYFVTRQEGQWVVETGLEWQT